MCLFGEWIVVNVLFCYVFVNVIDVKILCFEKKYIEDIINENK